MAETLLIILYFFKMVLPVALGFGIAVWMRYPYHMLQIFYISKIKRLVPMPIAYITEANQLTVAIEAKGTLARKPTSDGDKGFIRTGTPVNLLGLGNGYVYFEGCNVPLALDSMSLRESMKSVADGMKEVAHKIAYRAVSTEWMISLLNSWTRLGYSIGMAQANRTTKLGTYVLIGVCGMTLVLCAIIYLNMNELIPMVKIIGKTLLSGGAAAVGQGGDFGIQGGG